jgi:hypothetical protein
MEEQRPDEPAQNEAEEPVEDLEPDEGDAGDVQGGTRGNREGWADGGYVQP